MSAFQSTLTHFLIISFRSCSAVSYNVADNHLHTIKDLEPFISLYFHLSPITHLPSDTDELRWLAKPLRVTLLIATRQCRTPIFNIYTWVLFWQLSR